MDIPSQFKLLGHTITVVQVPPIKWKHKDCLGIFHPQSLTMEIRKGRGGIPAHTFLHELTHAILAAMGSDLYENEAFVDNFAGLMHQALDTAQYPTKRRK